MFGQPEDYVIEVQDNGDRPKSVKHKSIKFQATTIQNIRNHIKIKLQCINTGLIKSYSLLHTCEYSFISVAVAESPISSNQRSVSVLASFSAFLLPTFRIPSRKTFVIGT